MRNKKQTFIYMSDDDIATWLFIQLRDGKMTRDDIESEALEYSINPDAISTVVKTNDLFRSSGKEEWFLKKPPRPRVRLDAIEIEEAASPKRELTGFFF